ncbi:hypothetical protein LTR09_012337 [Extremus antarcticus]|uniref:Uncharacterized protein n=1 Tax=Extremus antarcticus TaxID=702011 RepID=A0AAJ0D5D1_9PEZI|nr:hypothetical protein LTR09_012337 [Extremus antarcticus]
MAEQNLGPTPEQGFPAQGFPAQGFPPQGFSVDDNDYSKINKKVKKLVYVLLGLERSACDVVQGVQDTYHASISEAEVKKIRQEGWGKDAA